MASMSSQPERAKVLRKIDLFIEQFGQSNQSSEFYSQNLAAICQLICGLYRIDSSAEDAIELVLKKSTLKDARKLAAVCFLRCIGANAMEASNLSENRIGPRMLDLVTEMLAELLRVERVETDVQNFEKYRSLEELISKIENINSGLIPMLTNINILPTFRQKYLQHISRYRIIFWPFFPHERDGLWIENIFSTAIEFTSAPDTQLLQIYDRTLRTLDGYRVEIEQFATNYCSRFVLPVIIAIIDLVTASFENSPMSKQAKLLVSGSEKKYPLHATESQIQLAVNIFNEGPGHGFDVQLRVLELENLKLAQGASPESFFGALKPGLLVVEIPAYVTSACSKVAAMVRISWTNYDKQTSYVESVIEFHAQRTDVPWNKLRYEQPYSLEPISSEQDLVGRAEVLDELAASISARGVGSCFVFGQKRVGKTSIVKSLSSRLSNTYASDFLAIYLEGGDYIYPDALQTLASLGRQLCKQIVSSEPRLKKIAIPEFDNALTPMVDFLADIQGVIPGYRILFILDEFDELPLDLYRRGEIGDAFFLTLRSISGKSFYGFVLVGGEKMENVLNSQGVALNKFRPVRIDYFDREHWQDYQDLVRKPVTPYVEFSDTAISHLFEETAGNPYFTKVICQALFNKLVQRRDCHVTKKEVAEAVSSTLLNAKTNSFQHFWEDGIFEAGLKKEMISIERRRALLSFAEAHRQYSAPTEKQIADCGEKYGIVERLNSLLSDFVRRQVFDEEIGQYRCHVPLFAGWLRDVGVREIITTFSSPDEYLARKKIEEENSVKPAEILALIKKQWGLYKGCAISEDQVRAWLAQFGDYSRQRLMFKILQQLRFYRADTIRAKLREAHGIVKRGLKWKIAEGKKKRADIVVSYLGGPGKSGVNFAKLYADENSIYYENIVEEISLPSKLDAEQAPSALVFLDDFVGTGNSASGYLRRLLKNIGHSVTSHDIQLYFIAITGFGAAAEAVERVAQNMNIPVAVHVCDVLDESAKCFSPNAGIFSNDSERREAKLIATELGAALVKNNPLGYGDCQTAIVFENSCPNNCLPILWAASDSWTPLFRRI